MARSNRHYHVFVMGGLGIVEHTRTHFGSLSPLLFFLVQVSSSLALLLYKSLSYFARCSHRCLVLLRNIHAVFFFLPNRQMASLACKQGLGFQRRGSFELSKLLSLSTKL